MSWTRHRRRHTHDAVRFIRAVVTEFGGRSTARMCGVNERTIRRWASGEDWPPVAVLHQLAERICPETGSLPLYNTEMAIDGNTRVVGVGDYSRRMARGEHEILEPLRNISWEEMERMEDEVCYQESGS